MSMARRRRPRAGTAPRERRRRAGALEGDPERQRASPVDCRVLLPQRWRAFRIRRADVRPDVLHHADVRLRSTEAVVRMTGNAMVVATARRLPLVADCKGDDAA